MKILLLFLLSGTIAFAQLPSSGSLSINTAAGSGRSIAQEVTGNTSGTKSLTTLSITAGKSAPHSMLEFRGYAAVLLPPGAPIGPMIARLASPAGSAGIEIGWSQPSSGGSVDRFRVDWQEGEPGDPPHPTGWSFYAYYPGTSSTPSIPHSALQSGREYFFRVRAENAAGSSSYIQSAGVEYP